MRDRLIELLYENNVHCDQKIEGLVDDVMDIVNDLINRQKAEIERLNGRVAELEQYIEETEKDDIIFSD